MKDIALLIINIEEYGKLMSYCIDNDIRVFRTCWLEEQKGHICYNIDFKEKKCYFAPRSFYETQNYKIIIPKFYIDKFGHYKFN